MDRGGYALHNDTASSWSRNATSKKNEAGSHDGRLNDVEKFVIEVPRVFHEKISGRLGAFR